MELSDPYQKVLNDYLISLGTDYQDKIDSIILFGSLARGEEKEDSDIDILIVTKEEDFKLRRFFIEKTFDILLETGKNLSVKVISRNDFQKHENFSFLKNVMSDGVKIA